jgi:putative SOS response-associated peptidase YedK
MCGRYRISREPASASSIAALLAPFPAERMRAYPIGPRVGNVKNDDAALIEPLTTPV